MCWLENDEKGVDTATVALALASAKGTTVDRSARTLAVPDGWEDWHEEMQQSALVVLEDWNADLVIGGVVREPGRELTLWFVPRSDGGTLEGTLGREDRWRYILEKANLGEDFRADLQAQLTATALAAVAPLARTDVRGQALEQGLRDATKKLATLLDSSTIEISEDLASLNLAYGNALLTLGERESGTSSLRQAVTAYRAALKGFTREGAPLQWAGTQNHLGIALRTLGERERGTSSLEEAVVVYRAVLKERTRERGPEPQRL